MTASLGEKGLKSMSRELQEWSDFMRATGSSAATIRIRLQVVSCLARKAGSPTAVTRRDVLALLARPTLKPWSKVTYWRAIKAWDGWALEFGHTSESIIKGIPAPKTPSSVARPISDDDIRALLASPMGRRTRAYVLLALYEGLRVHEVAGIKGEDFDFAAGWLTVKGKGGVVKPIPIHPEIRKLAAIYPEQGFWFPSHLNPASHVDPTSVSTTISNAMRAVGVAGSAHRLRDTAATQMQRQVRDLRITQSFLRHASVATTMKYTAVSDEALQAAAQAITWDGAA